MVLEARRLQKRQFIHDAVIARNEAKVEALGIEVEEAAAAAALALEAGKTYGTKLREGLSQTFSAENVGATIARAFEAGEGLMSALKSIGAQMATNLGSFFSKTLSSIPIVGPFLGRVRRAHGRWPGQARRKNVERESKASIRWSSLKLELAAAREAFAGFHAGAVEALERDAAICRRGPALPSPPAGIARSLKPELVLSSWAPTWGKPTTKPSPIMSAINTPSRLATRS